MFNKNNEKMRFSSIEELIRWYIWSEIYYIMFNIIWVEKLDINGILYRCYGFFNKVFFCNLD